MHKYMSKVLKVWSIFLVIGHYGTQQCYYNLQTSTRHARHSLLMSLWLIRLQHPVQPSQSPEHCKDLRCALATCTHTVVMHQKHVTCDSQQDPPPDDLGAALSELLTGEEGASSGLPPASPMPTIASAATPPAARYVVGKPPPAALTHHIPIMLRALADATAQCTSLHATLALAK